MSTHSAKPTSAMLYSEKFKEIQPTKISKNYIANAKQTQSQYQAYSVEKPMAASASSSALKHTTELHPAPRTREHSTPARLPLRGMRQQASKSPKPEDSIKSSQSVLGDQHGLTNHRPANQRSCRRISHDAPHR